MTHDRTARDRTPQRRRRAALLMAGTLLLGAAACGEGRNSTGEGGHELTIGLVTKTETNPYFVTMSKAAAAVAKKNGAKLIALSGRFDGDNEGQVAAMESLISRRVKGILITPSNGTGVLSTIAEARRQGILVIALDSTTQPPSATDATYATDNVQAGRLQGAYLRAALAGRPPKVIMLDGTDDSTVSEQRHDGFLKGFGITNGSPAIRGQANTNGERNPAQTAMENLLERTSDINTVYTINEPVAGGASAAIAARGLTRKVTIGSIDGGCDGIRDVKSGMYAATVMQFPVTMATRGVDAVVEYARSGKKPHGFSDTGTVLITDKPVDGLASQNTDWGLKHCWG
ncbi:substrate-binding domain-containing protein [Streptomyces yaanensis]|uniref:Substrate-binding domain-containing protein n=1 Tax=Streptomyces yaanensis TaxID=1142239 RepID=A0ABV7SNU4_9ACTN|nr:substrate-binding domain-containing protein [Streptomyces sp. CGMCC 4.7035]WNB97079.1 substrate-binding domain-containing protein [Streptomyces sp. CGMCC 4.7035]